MLCHQWGGGVPTVGISLLLAVARCGHSYCGSWPLPVSTCTWWLSLTHFLCVALCLFVGGGGGGGGGSTNKRPTH